MRSIPFIIGSRVAIGILALVTIVAHAAEPPPTRDGNRLAYLDEPVNPYYVHREFPRLVTPQWVGEEGVEAVVTLAIDDMRDPVRYEAYLRPILERLKKIDGRAPVSIMTCNIRPDDPQLQAWLKEGLSIECHTADHPCPLLKDGDFAKAKSTYDRCVEQMHAIPGNRPVAFRMPCCDSLNTPSPRFWAEIFNRQTPEGRFLQIDSSVFNVITSADGELPVEIACAGVPRFLHYLPFESFVNTIEDYPYPYVIGGRCWEFPCVVPSDWSAQHVQKPNNPDTVRDLKLALDATVIKRGVYNLVFHPHGWIRNDQIVELVDHAVSKYGNKVKFLTFRECQERLDRELLDGVALRDSAGERGPVRVMPVNADGFMDVVRFDGERLVTKIWLPSERTWRRFEQESIGGDSPRFGRLDGLTVMLTTRGGLKLRAFTDGWQEQPLRFADKLPEDCRKLLGNTEWPADADVRLRDFDSDGNCELIVLPGASGEPFFLRRTATGEWDSCGFSLPPGTKLAAGERDTGLLFFDLNADGRDDVLFSDAERFSVHLFQDMQTGWSQRLLAGERSQSGGCEPSIVPFIRSDGSNNGAWFHSRHIWWQNEDTNRLPDLVDRLPFDALLSLQPGQLMP